MKILLIEDDKRTASFIIKGLKQEGFTVEHASDGEEGLYMAEKEPVQLTDEDGTVVQAPLDVLLIREGLLNKIWFYFQNWFRRLHSPFLRL